MKNKVLVNVSVLVLFFFVLSIFSGCVSQPRYGDYTGLDKEEALHDLRSKKTSNGVKLALNWVLWGWVGFWIPSVVDTIRVITFVDDFNTIERRIRDGQTNTGTNMAGPVTPIPPSTPPSLPPVAIAARYSIVLNGQNYGPYDTATVKQMIQSGQITRNTLVWTDDMMQWAEAGTVQELSGLFEVPLPPQR
ncbi:MAG: DUF4339 domain-containing protein [Treponema sp.]|jgi:hypothetical protein|nr:DUF4339 domain-containing protein [Treponema sp.]